METASLNNMIKRPKSKVFRRLFVKRRQISDGLFETDWQDLSKFVISWGSFQWAVDTPRFGDLRFSNANISVLNIDGTFNPNDNADSFWFGYGDLQRSLVKIECGFIHQTLSAGGIWTNTEFPTSPELWRGIISGNIAMSGRGELNLPLRPTTQVFRDFLANDIRGFTSTGLSSGGWFALLRDQTDGSGNFVFRPFIGDATSTDWSITTGNVLYSNLNTHAAIDLHNLNVWQVSEKLAEAENSLAHITRTGKFIWQSKTTTAAVQYEFHGLGSKDRTYGQTIKRINRYGKRLTDFYSRVAVKFEEADTNTSFVNTALSYAVAGSNTAWNLGQRTFRIENLWIPNSATAGTVAGQVFDEVSSQSEEISFSTTLVPQLNILDKISVTYDATDFVTGRSLWDLNDWATDTTNTANDLYWDASRGDGIILSDQDFKLLSININLDKLESTFIAKQI
jgi:hypothetical protein